MATGNLLFGNYLNYHISELVSNTFLFNYLIFIFFVGFQISKNLLNQKNYENLLSLNLRINQSTFMTEVSGWREIKYLCFSYLICIYS